MVFDVYETLLSTGALEDKVSTAVSVIPVGGQFAIKQGIAEVKTAMRYHTMFLMLVIGLLVKLVFFPV